jgi:hypothetical protein
MTAAENSDPIWFNPPKFWAATREMSRDEAQKLLDKVIFLAETRDLNALRHYDFVSIGPHRRRPVKV